MEFLGTPLFDNDFLKLLFKFSINLISVLIIARYIYYPTARRKDYLFSYILISMVVFLVCFTLKKIELEIGMALGLFAIFGIIRYRTDAIQIKEMTYLFIIIGISVINSLSNKKASYAELVFANAAVMFIAFGLERWWLLKHSSYKTITYEKIELITPDKQTELKADLEKRTGLIISTVAVGKINFLNDTAQIRISYYEDEQTGRFIDEGN